MRWYARFWIYIAVLSFFCPPGFAQGAVASTGSHAGSGAAATVPNIAPKIGPGDMIDMVVQDLPELTIRVRLDDQGNVDLPLIGTVHMGGLTVSAAQGVVTHELVAQDFVRFPEVSILIAEYATQGVTVLGEVNNPGIYPLQGPHSVFDAIAVAGGFTARASRKLSITHRGDLASKTIFEVDVNSADLGLLDEELHGGDIVAVAKAGVVYVMGEVNRPGAFLLENNTKISLLQAVALAQGTTKVARKGGATVIRRTPQGLKLITTNYLDVLNAKAPDMFLEPEDILYIPTSKVKLISQQSLQYILATVVGITVYSTRF